MVVKKLARKKPKKTTVKKAKFKGSKRTVSLLPSGKQKILVTSALPYANGPIHLGHLVEYIQTDIYVRFLKLIGENAIYCCADDTHGTPIELSAMKEGIQPELLIEKYHKQHLQDFTDFNIHFDSYYTTNSPENKKHSEFIFHQLNQKKLVYQKNIELMHCNKCKRFLPDRYVKGKCPHCKADGQYGDVCEQCNNTHATIDLIDPYCTICGTTPVKKMSRHYFFKLSKCSTFLKQWITKHPTLQKEVKHYVLNWIKEGLKDWCISRDGPYFGFRIPGETEKYFYVWLDAPIGYIASTEHYCNTHKKKGDSVDSFWKKGKVIHVIGKDIMYFHLLFWPAILKHAGFSLPHHVAVHGFLTVNGEKMSKSRGTFLTARQYLDVLDPEYLRFYYASNLTPTTADINLDFHDFKTKVNNELVASLGNFAYRVLSFTQKHFKGKLGSLPESVQFQQRILKKCDAVKESYTNLEFREAVKTILEISGEGNKYFQEHEPWKLMKEDKDKALQVVTFCVNLVKNLAILITPVLPITARKLEQQLKLKEQSWNDLGFNLQNKSIGKVHIPVKKIEGELEVFALEEKKGKKEKEKKGKGKENQKSKRKEDKKSKESTKKKVEENISEPFTKLDLRVAKVVSVKDHPDADKLYVLQIDVGEKGKQQLVAGIKQYYTRTELKGKHIVVVANLKKAKLRGVESQGMLLAGESNTEVDNEKNPIVKVLEAPHSEPGDQVVAGTLVSKPKSKIEYKEFEQAQLLVREGVVKYKDHTLKTKFGDVQVDVSEGSVH